MQAKVGGFEEKPWKEPSITDRTQFLSRLGRLTRKEANEDVIQPISEGNLKVSNIEALRKQGRSTEAFFLARRMAAEGVEGAKELVVEILGELDA